MSAARVRPACFAAAIVAALLVAPLLYLYDRTAPACGDGLCGFGAGILILGGCLLASVILIVAGWVRGERPRWLVALAPLAFLLQLGWLAF